MSLASRVVNLFSPGTNSTQRDRNEISFVDDGAAAGSQAFADTKSNTRSDMSEPMESKALEDEGRPPYLHVSRNALGLEYQC